MGEKLNSFTVKIFLRIVKIRRRFKWSWLGTQWYLTACPNKDGSKAASSLGHLFFNNRDKDMETKKISWGEWQWWWHDCVAKLIAILLKPSNWGGICGSARVVFSVFFSFSFIIFFGGWKILGAWLVWQMLCPTLIFSHRRHNIEKKFTAKMITPLLLSLQIDSTLRADHGLTHAVKSKKLGWRNLTMEMIRDLEKLKRRYSERICFFFSYRWRNETCFCFLFLFKLKPFRFVLLLQYMTVPLYILVKSLHPHLDIHKMFSFQVEI